MLDLFFYFNFISAKQFISVLCSLVRFRFSSPIVSYPTNTLCFTLKFNFFWVYNTHTLFFTTSMTLHCSVNIYIISISALAFSSLQICFFPLSLSLFFTLSIVSFRPLMVLVSCYHERLTAANLRAMLALTMREPTVDDFNTIICVDNVKNIIRRSPFLWTLWVVFLLPPFDDLI